ncbi:MAG: DoxX family protein [Bacteroidota bacterium]
MSTFKRLFLRLLKPNLTSWYGDVLIAITRIIPGYLLTSSFGSDKFGMPWSPDDRNLGFLEVVYWFPQDVAEYGGLFAAMPVFFAWMGAASEAIGGLFFALGFQTRVSSFLILCTMLVAIFFQKWGGPVWNMLPAMGFAWVAIHHLINGSGRFGLDNLIYNYMKNKN